MSFNGKPVNNTVISRYKAQRSRGTEGFGFYIPETNRLTHNVREGRILSLLKRDKATEILFHHRFPTSTSNVRNACHPFSTKDTYGHNYVVVHNGVIQNDDDLQKKHYLQGIKYTSMQESGDFNDSEALTHDIAQYIEGMTDKLTARGNIAFIAIQRDNDGDRKALYFGRNYGNPLKFKATKKSFTLSSEGKGEMVEANKLYRWDYEAKSLTVTDMDIPEMSYSNYGYSTGYSYAGYAQGYISDEDGLEDSGRSADRFLDEGDTVDYERSIVKDKVEELLYDAFENPYDALTLAQDMLHWLRNREKTLDLRSMDDNLTDTEINEFCEIGDEIDLMNAAIDCLEKGVIAKTAGNFHYTPDSGNLALC